MQLMVKTSHHIASKPQYHIAIPRGTTHLDWPKHPKTQYNSLHTTQHRQISKQAISQPHLACHKEAS
jgi:hypothetical protein